MSIQHSQAAEIAVAAIKGEELALGQVAALDECDAEIQVAVIGEEVSARVAFPSELTDTGYDRSEPVMTSDSAAAALFREFLRKQELESDAGFEVMPGLRVISVF